MFFGKIAERPEVIIVSPLATGAISGISVSCISSGELALCYNYH